MAALERQLKDAGIVVPFMVNDHLNQGNWARRVAWELSIVSEPLSGGREDSWIAVYGIDSYPMPYGCESA